MPSTRSGKRKASSLEKRPPKHPRNGLQPVSNEIIEITDSSDDEDLELKDMMAQIKAQEDSERLVRQMQYDDGPSSSNAGRDLSTEDDVVIAQRLADEWAMEDAESNNIGTHNKLDSSSKEARASSAMASSSQQCLSNVEASNIPTKPDKALEAYRNVFTKTRNCSKCGKEVKAPRGCVVLSAASIPPSMAYLLHAPCKSCRTNHCRGCFTPISCSNGCKGPSKNPNCCILTCCAEVRALAIFETLGGFDRQYMTERAGSASRALAMAKKTSTTTSKSVGPGGTGYGTGATGVHHLSHFSDKSKLNFTKEEQNLVTESPHWDTVVTRAFNLLATFLPSPYTENPQVYDMLPHASIGHLVSLSQLPTVLAALLRNDSVTDWITRKETYNAMLSLLRRMADCELTIQCLIGQRVETETSCGLEDWMWGDAEITWTTNSSGDLEILPPLYTYFKKLTKQSEAFLAGATQMLGEGGNDDEIDETMVQGASLCGDIIAARDDLERVIAVLGRPSSSIDRDNRVDQSESATHSRRTSRGKGRDLTIHVDKIYEEACERLCFKHVSLAEDDTTSTGGLRYASYKYASDLTQTQNSTRNPKNRLHLLKELAVTATSLPPGVWVRVDEVRNDAIKIMIAGPEGTPYAGGLFEFDCFIPLTYPNSPPLMHLRTTGGGKVRFNPNLYDSGKVCLSLLGTWPGRPEEQWSPKSTLLQVLVSIQSMILIDAPYYNEPGHGQANVKSTVSIAYNRGISRQTVKWAIVDWLQDKHREGIWRDVIASHFTIKRDKIREQIVTWSKEDSSIRGNPVPMRSLYSSYPVTTNIEAQNDDLLTKFDKGMRSIESWKIGGDEETFPYDVSRSRMQPIALRVKLQ